jgi:hypothetical protein
MALLVVCGFPVTIISPPCGRGIRDSFRHTISGGSTTGDKLGPLLVRTSNSTGQYWKFSPPQFPSGSHPPSAAVAGNVSWPIRLTNDYLGTRLRETCIPPASMRRYVTRP